MQFTEEQKEQLKKHVEEDGFNLYSDMENAKIELNELSKTIKDQFGIEPKDFKKIVKLYFNSKFDEEKASTEYFNNLYESIVG